MADYIIHLFSLLLFCSCEENLEILLIKLLGNYVNNNKTTNKILLKLEIQEITLVSPPQIAYKLIEAGRSEDILQIQGLSVDGLNNKENTTIQ